MDLRQPVDAFIIIEIFLVSLRIVGFHLLVFQGTQYMQYPVSHVHLRLLLPIQV